MGDSRDRGAFKAGFPGAHSRDSRLIDVCGVCAHPPRFIYILTGGLDQTYVEKVGFGAVWRFLSLKTLALRVAPSSTG